ncbi:MAG: adenylate kinase [Deferribacterota bacterium]|nr:adenylate kinase [Deferribacterota bacterium]
MKNVVLLGAPGAGKGTQANMIREHFGLNHIATGDLIRDEIRKGSPLGIKAKSYSDKGLLAPDDLVINMIKDRIKNEDKGFLLDGFPRNVAQAKALDKLIKELGLDEPYIIYIDVDDNTVISRLTARRYCVNCNKIYNIMSNPPKEYDLCDYCGGRLSTRKDDNVDTVKKRLEVFRKETYPLIEYYKDRRRFHTVDGSNDPNDVFKIILDMLK